MGRSMMFAAGAFGASWLWLLALVVARYYGTWRRYDGWQEIKRDLTSLRCSGAWSGPVENIGIGAMLGSSATLSVFVLRAQFS